MTTPRNSKLNLCTLQILRNSYFKFHENSFGSLGGDSNNKLHRIPE